MSESDKKAGHREELRQRFLDGDAASRTDEALLELLLTYAIPRKDVRPIASRLISEFGSVSDALAAPTKTLTQVDGIGAHSAALLKLVDWLREGPPTSGEQKEVATSPKPEQGTLFGDSAEEKPLPSAKRPASGKKTTARQGTGLFGKALLKEAIALLPELPDTNDLDQAKAYIRAHLHHSAETTRQRNTTYITRRIFPAGEADLPMREFAKRFPGTQDLRDACFYRFVKTEPLVERVVTECLLPNIGAGRAKRRRLKDYLRELFPDSRSIDDCVSAMVQAFEAGGIAHADRVKLSFGYRDVPTPAFAFIVHSEFPEPGMYDISILESNRSVRAMLWKPDGIVPALYELRNRGLISKVSEIDNMRQFTTKKRLAEVVERLAAGEMEREGHGDS